MAVSAYRCLAFSLNEFPEGRSRIASAIDDPRARQNYGLKNSLRAWFELAGCWSLAVSWPIFQRLGSGLEVLTSIEVRGLDLLFFTVLIAFAAPTAFFVIEFLLGRFAGLGVARVFHALVLGLLAGLVIWQIVQENEVVASVALLAVTIAFAVSYVKTELARNFALLLGLATPVVLILFLFFNDPIRAEVLPGKPAMEAQSAKVDTPVVMIVLDELPLALLSNPQGKLDTRLFPQLARLRNETTWYPKTLAAGDQTLTALPVIMTGEDPTRGADRPPLGLPHYPDNLCSITAKAGYRVRAQEVVTDFCPRQYGANLRLSELLRAGFAPEYDPKSGSFEKLSPGGVLESAVEEFTDRHLAPYSFFGIDRPTIAKNFVDGLEPGKRTLDLLHILLPHAPYQFLAGGQVYPAYVLTDVKSQTALEAPESQAESLKHMQQAIAQSGLALRVVESVVSKMKKLGVWDESLFVVTADHGASFKVGTRRRTLLQDSAGWLLPVPLFIKYPGQQKGRVDDRFVTSRDITPTVLDVLGLNPSPRATGHSLLKRPTEPPAQVAETSTAEVEYEFDVSDIERQERAAIALKWKGFGAGNAFALGGHSNLLGKRVPRQWPPLATKFDTDGPRLTVDPKATLIPAYIQAQLPELASSPGPIAVTVNGRIAATTRAWPRDGNWMTGVNLPVGSFRNGNNWVKLYVIPANPDNSHP